LLRFLTFFGYEGRACEPSNFDCNYCYTLGHTIGALIELGKTGLLAVVRNLTAPVKEWEPAGIPVTAMLHIERRKGKDVPVIKKALVDLEGKPFKFYLSHRQKWATEDHYSNPGGLQYFGQAAELVNTTLLLEQEPEHKEEAEMDVVDEEADEKEAKHSQKDSQKDSQIDSQQEKIALTRATRASRAAKRQARKNTSEEEEGDNYDE